MDSFHVARDLLPAAAGRAVPLLHAVAPVHLGLVPGLLRAVVRQRHVPARHLAAAARVVTGGSVSPATRASNEGPHEGLYHGEGSSRGLLRDCEIFSSHSLRFKLNQQPT